MSQRRSRLEIYLNILEAVRNGVEKPTRIMYAAKLSWKPTKSILSYLIEQGLIAEVRDTKSVKSRRRYKITEKGIAVLDYFEKAKDLLPINEAHTQD